MDSLLIGLNGREVTLYVICLAMMGLIWRLAILSSGKADIEQLIKSGLSNILTVQTAICDTQKEMNRDLLFVLGWIQAHNLKPEGQ